MKEVLLVGSEVAKAVLDPAENYQVVLVDATGRLIVVPVAVPPIGTQNVNLIEVLGAAIAPGNPNIVGVFDALGNRMQVYPDGSIPIAPAKMMLAAFDALAGVAVVGSAANMAINTDHRGEGATSIEWDKVAGGALGGIAYTIPAAVDISKYSTHAKVMAFLYIPTPAGGTITNLYIALGTDAANLWYWEIPLVDIAYDQWKHYHHLMNEVDGVVGLGADLSAVTYVGVFVTTSVAGATLTDILVNDVLVKRTFETMINQEEGELLGTEDSGLNTNPERYIQDNKFSSWPIDRAGAVATLLYGIASPVGHRRTAGLDITIHWIQYHNHSGGPATVWLEAPGGTVQTAITQLADNQTVLFSVKPLDIGDEEIFVNASANDVQAQIGGVET